MHLRWSRCRPIVPSLRHLRSAERISASAMCSAQLLQRIELKCWFMSSVRLSIAAEKPILAEL